MMITISEQDKSAVQYACDLLDYKCAFYTKESVHGILRVEILDIYGNEVTSEMAWCLGRQAEAKINLDAYVKSKLD